MLPMSDSEEFTTPVIENILHPSDFTVASEVAFAHALKAALLAKASLTMLHVSPRAAHDEWLAFPGVRETLERWGLIPKGSPRSAVPRLGIEVSKLGTRHDDPARAVLHFLENNKVDLIVLATHQHDGVPWLHKSVAEPVARKSGQMTLFVPAGVDGFVSLADGTVSLTSVLIPIAATPQPQVALEAAARLVHRLGCPTGTFTVLHVGAEGTTPAVRRPDVPGWQWQTITRDGDVIETILAEAVENHAGLIVMSTDGRNGFLDALRGSHSERVLRRARCPVLAIPNTSAVASMLK